MHSIRLKSRLFLYPDCSNTKPQCGGRYDQKRRILSSVHIRLAIGYYQAAGRFQCGNEASLCWGMLYRAIPGSSFCCYLFPFHKKTRFPNLPLVFKIFLNAVSKTCSFWPNFARKLRTAVLYAWPGCWSSLRDTEPSVYVVSPIWPWFYLQGWRVWGSCVHSLSKWAFLCSVSLNVLKQWVTIIHWLSSSTWFWQEYFPNCLHIIPNLCVFGSF